MTGTGADRQQRWSAYVASVLALSAVTTLAKSSASHLAQMVGLMVAQFLAGAVGIAVAVAFVRSLTRTGRTIGNFWVDLTRAVTRVLLPIAIPMTLLLIGFGTIQNLHGNRFITTVEGGSQVLPGGPVASQVVAKTLGTNGGGFFNANSTHPFDNPAALAKMWTSCGARPLIS